ncbi:MAG TPA: anthranilate phosphoribosyltransferase [Terriglobales bacterium]|nr:anthranilate phosphoribosyltransferase [Terriglobales bacterium]
MLQEATERIGRGESLSRAEARALMAEVLAGRATPAQLKTLLVGLSERGETVEEIVGFAEAMRAAAAPLELAPRARIAEPIGADLGDEIAGALESAPSHLNLLVDTCGTGGDAAGTFNISTAAALVTAGAGVRVAKHGNRSISSRCGSADVMEALGVKLELPAERLAACLREIGIAFLYAPALHTAMKHVQPVRRELRIRTVFNLLGPLTNPAGAEAQVVGVYSHALVEKLAEALAMLGLRRALVVHGKDGLDEITITGPTHVAEVARDRVRRYEVTPEEFGLPRARLEDIAGGDAADNARVIREILSGEKSPRRDVVLLNAAATLMVAGRVGTIREGLAVAAEAVDSGRARGKLEELAKFTNT